MFVVLIPGSSCGLSSFFVPRGVSTVRSIIICGRRVWIVLLPLCLAGIGVFRVRYCTLLPIVRAPQACLILCMPSARSCAWHHILHLSRFGIFYGVVGIARPGIWSRVLSLWPPLLPLQARARTLTQFLCARWNTQLNPFRTAVPFLGTNQSNFK